MRVQRFVLAVAIAGLAACSSHGGYVPAGSMASPSGPREFVLYAFDNPAGKFGLPRSPANDGALPKGSLTLVYRNGLPTLYGRTAAGGNKTQCGTFFSILASGKRYRVVYRFSGTDGCDPRHDAMVPDPVFGYLWSTTEGALDDKGAAKVYNDGNIVVLNVVTEKLGIVHQFAGAPNDGAFQRSSVTFSPLAGQDTTVYGMAASGGTTDQGDVYELAYGSSVTHQLFSFSNLTGVEPHGRILLLGSELWGITRKGGFADGSGGGTVFVYPLASEHPRPIVVHRFTGTGNNADGYQSNHGNLTPVPVGSGANADTILYGMTKCGGSGRGGDEVNCDGIGDGVIFQVDANTRAYHTFYQFRGAATGDGANPFGSLLYDSASGYLYGMTRNGGTRDDGTVFRIAAGAFGSKGRMEILYSFTGENGDGKWPIDNVILSGKVLYGMTQQGGADSNAGTVFGVQL